MTSPTLGQMFGGLADAANEAEEVLAAMKAGTIDLSEAQRRVTRAGKKVAAVGRATRGRATAADIAIIAPRAAPAAVDASPSSTDAVEIVSLSVAKVRTDGGTQPRDHVAKEVVERYVEAMASGAKFPPVVVFYDGTERWLADGFHRWTAARALGLAEIEAEVHQGTQRDAVLYSVGANATHGYPRANSDKRRAVLTLLKDTEWSQWSDSEIARRCAVTHPFVGKLRAEITPVTVTSEAAATRTYTTRHGTTTTMKTARIGRSKTVDAQPPPTQNVATAQSHETVAAVVPFNSGALKSDDDAHLRQDIVASLHRAVEGAVAGRRNSPTFLKEAFEREVWKHERRFAGGGRQPPISFQDFVHQPYPVGLGADYATLRELVAADVKVLALLDEATGVNGRPPSEETMMDAAFVAANKSAAGGTVYRLRDLAKRLALPPEAVIACSGYSREEIRDAIAPVAEWIRKAQEMLK